TPARGGAAAVLCRDHAGDEGVVPGARVPSDNVRPIGDGDTVAVLDGHSAFAGDGHACPRRDSGPTRVVVAARGARGNHAARGARVGGARVSPLLSSRALDWTTRATAAPTACGADLPRGGPRSASDVRDWHRRRCAGRPFGGDRRGELCRRGGRKEAGHG